MSKIPNMWRDQDEFSIARRIKFHRELMRFVEEELIPGRPEPKDQKPISRNAPDQE